MTIKCLQDIRLGKIKTAMRKENEEIKPKNSGRITSLTLTPLKIQEINRNSCINYKVIRRNKTFAVVYNYADHKLYLISTEKSNGIHSLTVKDTNGQKLHEEISFNCFPQKELQMNIKSAELFNKINEHN